MRISDWSSDVCADDGPVSIVLDRTPFYAESGGQVGDTGRITTDTGSGEVLNTTYALPGLHLHPVRLADGEIKAGQEAVDAIRSEERRVGKECGSTCISRWTRYHTKKK